MVLTRKRESGASGAQGLFTQLVVVNGGDARLETYRERLESAGFKVVLIAADEIDPDHGNLTRFILKHRPEVVLYDVPQPRDCHWDGLISLLESGSVVGQRFVVTTENPKVVAAVRKDARARRLFGSVHGLKTIRAGVRAVLAR